MKQRVFAMIGALALCLALAAPALAGECPQMFSAEARAVLFASTGLWKDGLVSPSYFQETYGGAGAAIDSLAGEGAIVQKMDQAAIWSGAAKTLRSLSDAERWKLVSALTIFEGDASSSQPYNLSLFTYDPVLGDGVTPFVRHALDTAVRGEDPMTGEQARLIQAFFTGQAGKVRTLLGQGLLSKTAPILRKAAVRSCGASAIDSLGGSCGLTTAKYWHEIGGWIQEHEGLVKSLRITPPGPGAGPRELGIFAGQKEVGAQGVQRQYPGFNVSVVDGSGVWAHGSATYYFQNFEVYRYTLQDGALSYDISLPSAIWRISVGDNFLLFQFDEDDLCRTRVIDARLPDSATQEVRYLGSDTAVSKNALIEALNRAYYEWYLPDVMPEQGRGDQNMPAEMTQLLLEPGEREAWLEAISRLPVKH